MTANLADPLLLAVDVGGTKLAAAIVDGEGTVTAEHRVATPRGDDEAVWAALVEAITPALLAGGERLVGVGVGCGGPMARGGAEVSPLNIPGWRGFPLRDRLAEHTGLATWVDNDAKALALAEGWVGAATGRRDFVAMVVSTGVGGGIVLDGRLLDGADGNAGHIGHLIVEPGGRRCECGAQGCLEAEASGTAIAALTGRPAAEAPPEVRERTGTLVGRAVASVANLLDLDLAVVAGSVALGYGSAFFDAAQREIDRSARIEFAQGTVIRPAVSGAAAPLIGAAAVARSGLGLAVLG